MFPRNCWYVAAHAHEITDQLFARTFLNQPVILWRMADGSIGALEDRCPHRLVPLSTGKTVNGLVECGYHGLRFDATGNCAFVPGQDRAPQNAGVRTFPVAERHGLIWIYMAPGFNMTEVGFHAVGTDRNADHLMMRPIHLITPETDHTSHYIWGLARNFRLDDDELNDGIYTATDRTFKEDRGLLEMQDRRLQEEGMPKLPQMAVKVDKGPVTGRRLLDAMIQREADDPTYCAPPALLADDGVVSQPFAQAAE